MRQEFKLLESYFKRLYADYEIDQEFLRKVSAHIDLCERIAGSNATESDKECAVINRAKHWWDRRAEIFSMTRKNNLSQDEVKKNDIEFLRSLGITLDE